MKHLYIKSIILGIEGWELPIRMWFTRKVTINTAIKRVIAAYGLNSEHKLTSFDISYS